jgi:predicted metallo-beta-lactamase superfamily hydrolase
MNYHFGILFLDNRQGFTQIPDVIVAVAHYRYDHVTPLFLFPSIISTYKQLKSQHILH